MLTPLTISITTRGRRASEEPRIAAVAAEAAPTKGNANEKTRMYCSTSVATCPVTPIAEVTRPASGTARSVIASPARNPSATPCAALRRASPASSAPVARATSAVTPTLMAKKVVIETQVAMVATPTAATAVACP